MVKIYDLTDGYIQIAVELAVQLAMGAVKFRV